MKQETLEEASERMSIGIREEDYKDGFIEGAIWQAERMYSEEEVLEIIDSLFHMYASSFRIDAKEHFLQFKKK